MAVPDSIAEVEPGDTFGAADPTDRYAEMIVESVHPHDVEAVLALACELAIEQNNVYVRYLRGKGPERRGQPGYESHSGRWREAEAVAFALARAVAVVLLVHYPSPTGQPPILEAKALIGKRTGPLCNGWYEADDALTHHPDTVCPVHGKDNTSA